MTGLLVEQHGGVRTLTLNRPDRRNALDRALWAALREQLADIAAGGARAVVLTGAGGAFSGGADLSATADVEEFPDPAEEMRGINEVVRRLHELPVPTVAKVRGPAYGAGWNLALACDLVVAAPDARFCQIFTRRALSPDCGGSWVLPRLVGLQQAKRLTLLAEAIGAEEALALGLVTWIRPEPEIDAFTTELAGRLAAGAPTALAQTKALLAAGADRTLDEALEAETRAQAVNLAGPDVLEAFAAFLEKREPVFPGANANSGAAAEM
ncbi:enoyl-CoA hydratase-related protein [Nocardia sp. NPDC050697]|uniref:enoyl-CoA hydratase/isomerase family protein n=1 Tax=Nocardia sp. NPDC050697 TaxID=3155158 RepID=UPI0033F089F3